MNETSYNFQKMTINASAWAAEIVRFYFFLCSKEAGEIFYFILYVFCVFFYAAFRVHALR